MTKTDFNPASNASLEVEAYKRGMEKLAKVLGDDLEVEESIKSIYHSNLTFEEKRQTINDYLESRFTLSDIVIAKAGLPNKKNGIEKFIEARKNDKNGLITVGANSPLIVPNSNQRTLTEISGASLIGTTTHPELTELPNVIPTLQKMGITFNYVDDESSKQAIPTVISNVAGADISNGMIVGSIVDPVYGLCPGDTYSYTLQLSMGRRFFVQKTSTTDELFKQMINNALMEALLYRILNGETASGQCQGLYYNSDVLKVASASFDEDKGYALMESVHSNEAPSENCLWLLNSKTERLFKGRAYAGAADRRIIEKGLFLDKPYVLSERVSDGQVWYGAWQTVVLTLFNTQILIDAFSGSSNEVIIKLFQAYSSDIRHSGWVVCGTGVN